MKIQFFLTCGYILIGTPESVITVIASLAFLASFSYINLTTAQLQFVSYYFFEINLTSFTVPNYSINFLIYYSVIFIGIPVK